MSDYKLIEEVKTDGDIPVKVYVNQVTGLRVVSAYVECPIVKGDLVFATEAFDDDGLPHTLEHLVFLGSEEYPYKGVLDQLANKCLANGTNAYTDTDNTVYNLVTAGNEGFLLLLPIYLEHLLFPTLTDSGYVTEVHHIDGSGEDNGIVYCEMQARENTGDERCHLEMVRGLYPGRCGYKSQTGGILANLRESTSNQKCRDFHREFYHTKNLCVIVTGPIEPEEIFKAIKPIEDKAIARGIQERNFTRPWQTPVEPMPSSVTKKIQYSCDTDDDGLIYIGFRGPNVLKGFKELLAVSILLDYLNDNATSPLQQEFVECSEPYCSSISHDLTENSTSFFYLSFESVAKQYMDNVTNKLFELLRAIQSGKKEFDINRLKTIISRKIVRILSTAETSPHSLIIGSAVGDFLYGQNNLKQRCQEIPFLEEFGQYDSKYWLELIEKYMTGPTARYSCIIGEPSPSFMKSMSEIEKKRIADQKDKLKNELPDLANRLEESIKFNDRPAPKSMLNSFKRPSPDSIKYHQIERNVLPRGALPFRFQYDNIKTNFVNINLLLNSSSLTKQDRLFLPLMKEMVFESPIMRNGQVVPYETVVSELYSDTIAYGNCFGLSGSTYSVGAFSMLFEGMMQVERSKYEKAVKWCHELLYQTVYCPKRIKTVATRMLSDISQYKRSGSKVLSSAFSGLLYQSNSNNWAVNFMRQQKFLKNLLNDLKNNPDSVQKDLTRIRDALAQPNNILVHIAFDKDKLDVSKIHEPWLKFVPQEVLDRSGAGYIDFNDITQCHELIKPLEDKKAVIVGLGSVESNFLQQMAKSINSYTHPDLPALYVLIQYLTQLEGPLWRQIRGLGLSYHYDIGVSPSDGAIHFMLYKSTQLVAAYKKAVEVVDEHLDLGNEFDDGLLESAKSTLIFDFIKREKSPADKSMQSLLAHLRGLDINFNKDLIRKVVDVTKENLRRVGPLYLKPLFTDQERRTAVCCHPSKINEITKGYGELDCKLQEINLDESFLNSLD